MGNYSKELQILMEETNVMDENLSKKFYEIVKVFRPFQDSLSEFMKQYGYQGDINDLQAKINDMKQRFKEAKIPMHRHIDKWFKGEKEISRETAFKICIALKLNCEQSEMFFRKVMLERGFDYHNIKEAIYYFGIKKQMKYDEIEEMIHKVPKVSNQNQLQSNTQLVYTAIIKKAIDQFENKEQLIQYLCENQEQFTYNNVSATLYIQKLWEMIANELGYANQELAIDHQIYETKQRSNFKIYEQIIGYDQETMKKIKGDRSLSPLFKNNDMIHPYVSKIFPSRQTLENILRGEHVEYEGIRKMLIFLLFYKFWVMKKIKKQNDTYYKEEDDEIRCMNMINKYLVELGYPTLYIGNPYDWLFMWACYDESPLWCFRYYMNEVFNYKNEMS